MALCMKTACRETARALAWPAALLLVALALLAAPLHAQVTMADTPRRYLVIHAEGANRDWEVRPIRISDKTGGTLQAASEGDFQLKVDRWERTGMPRRYNTKPWVTAMNRYGGASAPPDSRFYFYAITPKQPSAEGKLNLVDARRRIYWVPMAGVQVKSYPQTWVDIWESYVGQFNGEERQNAVKEWEAAHRDTIKNEQNLDGGFSPEERNEFARFYQAQFVYIRDKNPRLPGIYDELAAFHKERGNLDAELSTYLDALRSKVPSPDLERFQLAVGRILVERLLLYEDARPYLTAARQFAEARYLLALCELRLGHTDKARDEINALLGSLTNPAAPEPLTITLPIDDEIARANLLLGEVEMGLGNFGSASAALDKIPAASSLFSRGRVLFCAMLLYRNERGETADKSDMQKIRDTIKSLPLWTEALGYTQPKANTVYPLNPEMARALVLYVQADGQYSQPVPKGQVIKPTAELIRMLTAARALDPLSSEPYLAEGRLQQHLGNFKDAMAAYMAGLDVNPKDALLLYAVADLNFKAGVLSAAKDYLGRCLKVEPNFYPALTRMGEIAVLDVATIREAMLIKISAGESVDYAGELVPPMKEAGAFWTASLAIYPDQKPTQLALATLYLQLAELAPLAIVDRVDAAEVRRAYLVKARDLSQALVAAAIEYARNPKPGRPDDRTRAEAPDLSAYNTYAFALYALGDYAAAKQAFEDHINAAKQSEYFPDSQAKTAYLKSASLAFAAEWARRINENDRRYFETIEFRKDSTAEGYFGEWAIALKPKPDTGFSTATTIKAGLLNLGVDQRESGLVSRIEVEKSHATLAVFEAEFVKTGDAYMNRGVEITKCSSAATGDATPQATIMLGVDTEGRVYWETRRFKFDNAAKPEEVKDYGLIDVRSYGGLPLNKNEKLTLALRRQLSDDMSAMEWVAVINGFEVKLNVTVSELTAQDLKQGQYKLRCGFYTQAVAGVKGTVQVRRVKCVYDSGLSGKAG